MYEARRMVTRSRMRRRYNSRMVRSAVCWPVVAALVGLGPHHADPTGQGPSTTHPQGILRAAAIPYAVAKPILEQLRPSLPAELAGRPAAQIESIWADWVSRRNLETRARLERGDEDSIVNFLLF